jgi:hypothetical protein
MCITLSLPTFGVQLLPFAFVFIQFHLISLAQIWFLVQTTCGLVRLTQLEAQSFPGNSMIKKSFTLVFLMTDHFYAFQNLCLFTPFPS